MSVRETADEIEEAAARWVLVLDREPQSPERAVELEAWLAGDPRRRGAFLQAEAAWTMLEAPDDYAGEAALPERRRLSSISRRGILGGAGAALAASFVGGIWLLGASEEYRTGVGEIRRVPLADGSTVAVNTDSRISVAMSNAARAVSLDRGEAWFRVAKDRSRPFTVTAGRVHVRAVGTAFSVRLRGDSAEILVTEGVVEVWTDGREGAKARLSADQHAILTGDARMTEAAVAPSEVDRKLAWRSGRIDLAGESLASASAEFNRYNGRRIEVAPAVADKQLYGIFRTDDPEGFARAIQLILGVPVSFEDPNVIRIGDR